MYNLGVPNANPCSNFDVKPGLSVYDNKTNQTSEQNICLKLYYNLVPITSFNSSMG